MTKYEITFPINNITKIIIPLKDPVEWLGPIYQKHILFLHDKEKIILSKDAIYHDMLDLANLLKKALNQELFLHTYITKEIGYLHNQYIYDNINIPICTFSSDNNSDWIGYKYHLWSARNDLVSIDSWIYNAPDESIIFEVTPIYPYMYCEPEEEPDYIPYEEWIKTYKPYFITTLSREIAEQWLEQAEYIIKIVEDNQRRWELRSKIDVDS